VTSVLPGLDLERLGAWFAAEIPDVGGELTATLIAGGKSNLTFLVTDGASEWIVRRPPLGHVLATAHDMVREYRVMSALHDTPVPVPPTYALCRDAAVVGAEFYVMGRCAGTPFRRADELAVLGPERTRDISTGLVDTLVALHQVDAEDPPFLLKLAPRGAVIAPAHRGIARGVSRRTRSATHRPLPG
jgi:aminoglycoside phosphotransferase (APT) family kinase protein